MKPVKIKKKFEKICKKELFSVSYSIRINKATNAFIRY